MIRRSRTGFVIYLNQAPIYWFSKQQNGVECSTFWSEFVAMKQCCEYVRGMRYKLRMMRIPVIGCSFLYGDNQSILCNTCIPNLTLKKENHAIVYHFIREEVAKDEWVTGYIKSENYAASQMNKSIPEGEGRDWLVGNYLYDMKVARPAY